VADPVIAQKAPYPVDLAPGKYSWCACGLSAKQPFCDGAHKAVGLHSVKFVVAEAGTHYLCGCKRTGTPPFCDGAHKKL
jgi:CDGSH iron-sulfur domain-containing protein 3